MQITAFILITVLIEVMINTCSTCTPDIVHCIIWIIKIYIDYLFRTCFIFKLLEVGDMGVNRNWKLTPGSENRGQVRKGQRPRKVTHWWVEGVFLNTRSLKNLHRLKKITELIRRFNQTLFQHNIMGMMLVSTNHN